MSYRAKTIEMIDRKMIKGRITQRLLADKIGVTEARGSQMLGTNSNMTLKTVDRILDAIKEIAP